MARGPKKSKKRAPDLRAKVFRNGRSQAIRLPKEVRFEGDPTEVKVRREGRKLIVEPVDDWPNELVELAGSVPDFPDPPAREPLSSARDRLGE
jgi:antitoxin VapB